MRSSLGLEALRRASFPDYPNDAQIEQFYAALGGAVSGWQHVETALYRVYEFAVAPGHPGAAGAAFHAIQTFNVKMAVTDAAVRFRVGGMPTILEEWGHLNKKANKKSQRRNQLAHFTTFIMFREKHENDKIRLQPQVYDYRHGNDRPVLRMTEIQGIAVSFHQLSNQLHDFSEKLRDLLRQP